MMKKYLFIIACVLAVLAACACSKTTGPSSAVTTAQSGPALTPTPDMKKWEIGERYTDFAPRAGAGASEFKGRIFACGGRQGNKFFDDVWATSDCVYWVTATAAAPFGPRADFGFISHDGRIWVIGGTVTGQNGAIEYFNDVWSSPDGVSWTAATLSAEFPKRSSLSAAVFKGEIYITGGTDGRTLYDDAWHSKDGKKWVRSKPGGADRAFPGRRSHASAVHGDRLWVSGGEGAGGELNDVWYTADGADWKNSTPSAAFSPRAGHVMQQFKGRLWVIGGGDRTAGKFSDVWWSVNGYNWVSVTAAADFGRRAYMGAAVLDNTVWLISGLTGREYARDIWAGR